MPTRWPLSADEFKEILRQKKQAELAEQPRRPFTKRQFIDTYMMLDEVREVDLHEQLRRKWTP